ncbi:MAG: alpha/beta fold hydrolase [Solirubrobacterales bacterium]
MPTERTFDASAVTLNYLDYGSPDAEPLVMLHGGAWRWQEFLSLIPSLGRRWHVQALDLRGNGGSGWSPGDYRLRDFAQDNAEFVRSLQRPAVLVGHSIGGVIALMVAQSLPDKTKAVIVEDAPIDLGNYRRIIEASRTDYDLWLKMIRSSQSEQELALQIAGAYGNAPGVTSSWILFFAGCLSRIDPTFFDNLLNDFDDFASGYDCRSILENIDCPVLYLRGDPKLGAVMTDDEIAWLKKKNFSNVKPVPIEAVGHLLHLETHGQMPVLAAMTAFLERI